MLSSYNKVNELSHIRIRKCQVLEPLPNQCERTPVSNPQTTRKRADLELLGSNVVKYVKLDNLRYARIEPVQMSSDAASSVRSMDICSGDALRKTQTTIGAQQIRALEP